MHEIRVVGHVARDDVRREGRVADTLPGGVAHYAGVAPADLGDLRARMFHLGPLTEGDMSVAFLDAVAARAGRVSLDVQGFTRRLAAGAVRRVDWAEKARGLARVGLVKADLEEARTLTGEDDPERAARARGSDGGRRQLHGRLPVPALALGRYRGGRPLRRRAGRVPAGAQRSLHRRGRRGARAAGCGNLGPGLAGRSDAG